MIDSHVHLLDPARSQGLVWPDIASPIHQRCLPNDLQAALPNLRAIIAVETSRRSVDDAWLLQIADQSDLVRGVVLNLQPDEQGFAERLQRATRCAKFRGIRLRPIVDYDLSGEALHSSMRQLQDRGLSVEFGAASLQLRHDFASLAATYSQSNWILDHAGFPEFDGINPSPGWARSVEEVAGQSNTFAKLTSPMEWAGHIDVAHRREAAMAVISILVSCFGSSRLLYASNWPVSSAIGSYADNVASVADLLTDKSDAESAFHLAALAAYRL